MERVVSVYRQEHEPLSAGAANRPSFFLQFNKSVPEGKTNHSVHLLSNSSSKKCTGWPCSYEADICIWGCLPSSLWNVAGTAGRKAAVFFMGKWRAGGGRTCAYNSRQRLDGVAVVPFWLYFCLSSLFSFHKHSLKFPCDNRPSLTCDHLLIISVPIITLGEYQLLVTLDICSCQSWQTIFDLLQHAIWLHCHSNLKPCNSGKIFVVSE